MARGNNSRGRGRGFRGEPGRGPGRGRGRGSGRGRGRGRGGEHDFIDQLDFVVQQWPDHSASRGYESPRSRGRGRGGQFSHPNSGSTTPGRGRESHRGRGRGSSDYLTPGGRGRGLGGSKLRPDAPLSSLLYQERPLLRPVIFVRSVHTRTLFEEEEEILQAVVEQVDDEERSHVPTADRVNRVFSGSNIPWMERTPSEDDPPSHDAEELEEIDFDDMGRLREEVDAATLKAPALNLKPVYAEVAMVEEKFTGCFIDVNPTSSSSQINNNSMTIDDTHIGTATLNVPHGMVAETELALPPNPLVEEEFSNFYIDTNPTPTTPSSLQDNDVPIVIDRTEGITPLGDHTAAQEQDEVIVYVAPHPRSGKVPARPEHSLPPLPSTSVLTGSIQNMTQSTPPIQPHPSIPSAPSFESVSFSFANSPISKKQPHQAPAFNARAKAKAKVKERKREARVARMRIERQAMFGSFGAIMSEAQLRGDETGKWKRDPRWDVRRRDDSDVDWGDEDEDDSRDPVDLVPSGADGMDLDPELELSVETLTSFVKGMSADGGKFVTMDDIADMERMRWEDQEGRVVGSDGEEGDDEDVDEASSVDEEADAVVGEEEQTMIAEPGGVDLSEEDESDDDEDSSGDENESPRTGFQARLERLRKNARGKRPADAMHAMLENGCSSDDDHFFHNRTWAEEDEDFIAHVEALLDENDQILTGRDRKEKNRLFRAVRNGAFEDMEGISPTKRGKGKDQVIPPELREQWQKDRDKKAENKQARALARLQLAADPLSIKKGGKKGRKAMLAAARLNPTITVLPNHIIDMTTLEQQIRRFVVDLGGPSSMSLPPMDKGTRKGVHELANAFNLKSLSKGKGDARYTTLTKTTRSGIGVNGKKVAKIVRRSGGVFMGPEGRDNGKNKTVVPRHKDGDEVGKAAPKIGESNIGFKILASMGWTEGDRIGVSGGLHVPLTAVIKNTKRGLGANR